jgi:hypothetical protein
MISHRYSCLKILQDQVVRKIILIQILGGVCANRSQVSECLGDFLGRNSICLKFCESVLEYLTDFIDKSHEPGFDLDATFPQIVDKLALVIERIELGMIGFVKGLSEIRGWFDVFGRWKFFNRFDDSNV